MCVLLDENLPHDLISELGGQEVVTVQGLGWAGVKNGELLRRLVEPTPTDAFREVKPEAYERLLTHPEFLIVRAVSRAV